MDIVERLRRKEHDPYCGQCIDGRLSEEAADEIERLREALKKIVDVDWKFKNNETIERVEGQCAKIARAALKEGE